MAIMTVKYAPHEIAKIFPEMTGDEKRELTHDIKKHGLQEPIVLFEDKVLDGRSRQECCARSNQKPRYVEFADLHPNIKSQGPLAFAIGRNLKRRHLTASQRAILAAKTIPAFEKEARARQLANLKKGNAKPAPATDGADGAVKGKAAAQAAKAVGVSTRSVERAKKILKEEPEKAEEIKAGRLTIGKASKPPVPKPAPKGEKRFTLKNTIWDLVRWTESSGRTYAVVGTWKISVRKI